MLLPVAGASRTRRHSAAATRGRSPRPSPDRARSSRRAASRRARACAAAPSDRRPRCRTRCDDDACGRPERLALFRRRQQRAQTGEAVRAHQPERHELGKRFLDLRAQHARAVDDLVEERCAVLAQELRDIVGAPARDRRMRRCRLCTRRVHSGALRRGSKRYRVSYGSDRRCPRSTAFAGSVKRVQIARPDRQRSSSHVKS